MSVHKQKVPLPWIALGVLLGALLVYLGVTTTAPDFGAPARDDAGRSSRPLVFAEWGAAPWSEAAARPALVFLLVADSLSPRSAELESALDADHTLRSLLSTQFVPVRIERRHRPDLTERYAENHVPHLSVLLPTGEAIARITGEPDTWSGQLVETARYWRDHQSEIQNRALAFWLEQEADSLPESTATPQLSDLAIVDSAVFGLVRALVRDEQPGPALWRTDLDRYLAAHDDERALSLRTTLRRARALRADELRSASAIDASPAEWANTVIELRRYGGLDGADTAWWVVQREWARHGGPATAEEVALGLRGAVLSQAQLAPAYPGRWLGFDSAVALALPHRRDSGDLDGYLTDALAWLEFFLEAQDPALLPRAVRLGDSLWGHLWDPVKLALRDKPVGVPPSPVRERVVYPRVQLGRLASLFDRLALESGEHRFAVRADSCLAGFAPYVRQAGAAATYYGEALLLRKRGPDLKAPAGTRPGPAAGTPQAAPE